ncbi:MAG: hypothetical protein RIM84_09190 [Alphaproteobacteria bacterium]
MRWALAALALFAASPALAVDDDVAGTRPTYIDRALYAPANGDAIRHKLWVPGIDDGDVPQGLTVAGDHVILGTYNSEGRSPACRLYRIERATLKVTGHFDLGHYCGHAGGLAYGGGDRLFVSDTGRLYELSLAKAFDPAQTDNAVVKVLSLRFPLKGSFLAYRDGELWVGTYKKPGNGVVNVITLATFAAATEPPGLSKQHVARSLEISPRTQGAAFDADGMLWLSQSDSQRGTVQKVDPETGEVLATYRLMAGLEDIGFAPDGLMWTSSEAGSKRWATWGTYYPLVFSLDPAALR